MNGLAHLSNDELDAIATHAGSLLLAIERVKPKDVIPFFREELWRLEEAACTHLVNRGAMMPLPVDEE